MKKTIKQIFIACLLLSTTSAWAQKPCKQVIGYYCDWLTNTVDFSKYTILNYAFVEPNADGTIKVPAVATTVLTNMVSQAHANGVKALVSVGGWTWSNNFPAIASTDASRKKFASECQRYITTYGLDGIDIDWEYPGYTDHMGTAADKVNCTLLFQEIRKAIGSKLLTACYGCAPDRMLNIEWSKLISVVDMFNLMTYDFFGAWDATTNHNSPLYAPAQGHPSLNLSAAFKAIVNTYGVPSTKVNIGVAFYGHSFLGATALFGSHSGADTGWNDGSPIYSSIVAQKGTFTEKWDDQAKVPYLLGNNKFVSYDNEESVKLKGKFAAANNACGAIVWEISGDRIGSTNPLATALNAGLCNGVGVEEETHPDAVFYPNPSSDLVYVTIQNGYIINNISVYNSLGQLVISQQANQYQFSIDLKGLEKGVYLVNIASEHGVISKTVVKE
jgi:GH18 family chitinase